MDNSKPYKIKYLVLIAFIYELIFYLLTPYINSYGLAIFISFIIFTISLFILYKKHLLKPFYIIFIIGLLIRTFYILNTSIYTRAHDIGTYNYFGHLGYIYTIFKTSHLPTVITWQFYHPPLWHLLGTIWLFLNNIFHYNIENAFEGLQILTLMFSLFSVVIVDKLNIKMKIKDKYRYLIDLLIMVHPTMIIFSGSINNDPLLLFLQYLTLLCLFNFYEKTTWKNTIILAIVTGLSVMTKSSGALMAVPIIYVFIIKFIGIIKKHKKELKTYLFKIFTFGMISLPIGLWHPIRNLILFSTTKIPDGGEYLYIGDLSIMKRFFIPNFHELMNYADMSKDYNLPTYIIKSSIFGEFSYDKLLVLSKIMIIVNTLLIIVSLIFIIKYFFKKKKNIYTNILVITWIAFMISMYIFNYVYPYRCSMDFRYIPICIFPSMVILVNEIDKIKNKYLKLSIEILCYIFIILSTIFMLFAI